LTIFYFFSLDLASFSTIQKREQRDEMTKEEIIETLKEHYNRDIRKQLVKSIAEQEKEMSELDKPNVYKTINQIFSFVLQETGWTMRSNSKEWNDMPLEVMKETFPQITNTKWYAEQILMTKQSIDIEVKE